MSCSFQAGALLSQKKKGFKKSQTVLDFFFHPFATLFLPVIKQAESKRLMHVQSAML